MNVSLSKGKEKQASTRFARYTAVLAGLLMVVGGVYNQGRAADGRPNTQAPD